MLRGMLILALLGAAPVRAEEFCASRFKLRHSIFMCYENSTYAEQAGACSDRFRELVHGKQKELSGLFSKQLAGRKGDAQNQQFQLTQKDYATTDATLVEAINLGRGARQELVFYLDDVVPPHNWPLALGRFPGMHHPYVQELFRAAGCYKEAMEGVERAIQDMDRMIAELEATRAKTAQLFKTSGSREAQLDLLKGLGGASGTIASGSGSSQAGASDVTGLREDKAKRKGAASLGASGQLSSPESASPSPAFTPAPGSVASQLTQGKVRAPATAGARAAGASSGRAPFSELQTQSRAFASSSTLAPGIDGLKQEKGSSPGEAPSHLAAAAVFSDQDAGSLSGVELREELASSRSIASMPGQEGAGSQVSALQASTDETLFARVQRRYRASQLFRTP